MVIIINKIFYHFCIYKFICDLDFGDEDVKTLLDHFRPVLENADVDVYAAEDEWLELKQSVYKK